MPKKAEQPLTEKKVQKMVDKAVDDVAQATNKAFQGVESDIADLKDDMVEVKGEIQSLKSGQAAILRVVQGIDKQLKEHRTHPQRITRLERAVFR